MILLVVWQWIRKKYKAEQAQLFAFFKTLYSKGIYCQKEIKTLQHWTAAEVMYHRLILILNSFFSFVLSTIIGQPTPILLYQVRALLRNHDDGSVDVAGHNVGHDGGVHHPQPVHPMDLQSGTYNRCGV